MKTKILYFLLPFAFMFLDMNSVHLITSDLEKSVGPCDEFTSEYNTFDIYGKEIRLPNVYDFNTMQEGFFPIVNEEVTITSFAIYTPEDWNNSRIMYSAKHLVKDQGQVINGWNGESRYVDDKYSKEHEGRFRYTFFASVNNKGLRFEGWGCLSRTQ